MLLRPVVLTTLAAALLALVLLDGLALALRTPFAARLLRQRDRSPVTFAHPNSTAPKTARDVVIDHTRRVIAVVDTTQAEPRSTSSLSTSKSHA